MVMPTQYNWAALFAAFALAFFAHQPVAKADFEPAGAISGSLHVEIADGDETRLGGALNVDIFAKLDVFRVGFVLGVGAFTNGADNQNRIYVPLGLSLGVRSAWGERFGLHVIGRGGVYTGADFDGLTAGGFGSIGLTFDLRFEGGLDIGIGADVWAFSRRDDSSTSSGPRIFISPTLALRWTPQDD